MNEITCGELISILEKYIADSKACTDEVELSYTYMKIITIANLLERTLPTLITKEGWH